MSEYRKKPDIFEATYEPVERPRDPFSELSPEGSER